MCLAVPMQIDAISELEAECSARGVSRKVSLGLVQDLGLKVGDWVLVHIGYAIRTVSESEAQESWKLFDILLED